MVWRIAHEMALRFDDLGKIGVSVAEILFLHDVPRWEKRDGNQRECAQDHQKPTQGGPRRSESRGNLSILIHAPHRSGSSIAPQGGVANRPVAAQGRPTGVVLRMLGPGINPAPTLPQRARMRDFGAPGVFDHLTRILHFLQRHQHHASIRLARGWAVGRVAGLGPSAPIAWGG